VLTRHPLHERCRRHDRDLAERIEREQIAVAGDDEISMAVDGQFEEFVVVRITACGDPLGDSDQLSPSEQLGLVVIFMPKVTLRKLLYINGLFV
jgi:hypothetical protein